MGKILARNPETPKNTQVKLLIPTIILFLSYGIFVWWNISYRGIFEYIGIDYRLLYASGMIARYHGFASIYDVVLQTQYQSPLYYLYPKFTTMIMEFWPLPLPYLPVFIVPFLMLTFFTPINGFLIWSAINLVGTCLYIMSFLKRENLSLPLYKFLFIFLSLPLFLNLIFGQVNLWLFICLGEFSLALMNKRDLKSGLWLGGLLLKPQLLILFIPGLLIQKKNKVLIGLLFSSLFFFLVSLILAGEASISGPINVILHWPTSVLGDSGMNLLSLSNNLSKNIPFEFTRILLIIFSILFFLVGIKLWIPRKNSMDPENIDLLILTTFAITCTISPHSNVHMAIPIILLGLSAYLRNQIPASLVLCWVLIPSTLFLIVSFASIGDAHAVGGTAVLGMNIAIIIWMILKRDSKSIVYS
jgi:hypothetical protein